MDARRALCEEDSESVFDAIFSIFEGAPCVVLRRLRLSRFLFSSNRGRRRIFSVCNVFRARIQVAFAYQNQRNVPASGWWSVEPNACQTVDFSFQGATLYYAADSDDYKEGTATSRDHWGNKIKLFVGDMKFDFDDAQAPRSGTTTKMFSLYEIPQQFLGKPTTITFHFVSGKTNITITGSK
jgi:uncharacterized membrane protein